MLFISEPINSDPERKKSVRHIKPRFVSRLAASHEYPNYNDNTRVQVQFIVLDAGISRPPLLRLKCQSLVHRGCCYMPRTFQSISKCAMVLSLSVNVSYFGVCYAVSPYFVPQNTCLLFKTCNLYHSVL